MTPDTFVDTFINDGSLGAVEAQRVLRGGRAFRELVNRSAGAATIKIKPELNRGDLSAADLPGKTMDVNGYVTLTFQPNEGVRVNFTAIDKPGTTSPSTWLLFA